MMKKPAIVEHIEGAIASSREYIAQVRREAWIDGYLAGMEDANPSHKKMLS